MQSTSTAKDNGVGKSHQRTRRHQWSSQENGDIRENDSCCEEAPPPVEDAPEEDAAPLDSASPPPLQLLLQLPDVSQLLVRANVAEGEDENERHKVLFVWKGAACRMGVAVEDTFQQGKHPEKGVADDRENRLSPMRLKNFWLIIT